MKRQQKRPQRVNRTVFGHLGYFLSGHIALCVSVAVSPVPRVANSHLRTALFDQSSRVGPNFVKAGASLLLPAAPSHKGFRRETRSPEDGAVNRVA